MTQKPENPPAFPARWRVDSDGMTLRDYFACSAMNTIVSTHVEVNAYEGAKMAYEWADAMLEERLK